MPFILHIRVSLWLIKIRSLSYGICSHILTKIFDASLIGLYQWELCSKIHTTLAMLPNIRNILYASRRPDVFSKTSAIQNICHFKINMHFSSRGFLSCYDKTTLLYSNQLLSIWIGVTMEMQNLVQRRIYPFLLMVVVLMGILSFQIRQFKRLYEHIKNDKWVLSSNSAESILA